MIYHIVQNTSLFYEFLTLIYSFQESDIVFI